MSVSGCVVITRATALANDAGNMFTCFWSDVSTNN